MPRKLIDRVPETGIETYFHGVNEQGLGIVETTQDAEDIVNFNADAAKNLDKKHHWWFIGSVPLTLCQQWATESGAKVFTKQWQEYAKKQLNKPEYGKLNPNKITL